MGCARAGSVGVELKELELMVVGRWYSERGASSERESGLLFPVDIIVNSTLLAALGASCATTTYQNNQQLASQSSCKRKSGFCISTFLTYGGRDVQLMVRPLRSVCLAKRKWVQMGNVGTPALIRYAAAAMANSKSECAWRERWTVDRQRVKNREWLRMRTGYQTRVVSGIPSQQSMLVRWMHVAVDHSSDDERVFSISEMEKW